MPRRRLEEVTSLLRERIRDAAEMGAMQAGDRMPGTRRLAAELGADPRLVAAAFHRLEGEGLVRMRARSGVYLAGQVAGPPADRALAADWVTEVVAQAVERGMPAHKLAGSLDRMVAARQLRAAVVAATSDQAVGMVRELQDDYGITSAAIFPQQLRAASYPKALLRAQLIVTTTDLSSPVRKIATALGKSVIVVRVRPDLFSGDWIAFMNGPVCVVVSDPGFRVMLRQVMKPLPGSANVEIILAGSPEISRIPRDARTYVTESARRMLGRGALPGRVIRPRRVFSSETVRAIAAYLASRDVLHAKQKTP